MTNGTRLTARKLADVTNEQNTSNEASVVLFLQWNHWLLNSKIQSSVGQLCCDCMDATEWNLFSTQQYTKFYY
jgi:hypothetical protein